MATELDALIAELRSAGGDCTNVEVKSAAGGLPQSLTSTLSALANLPGGGTIILGLDERAGFRPVLLSNPQDLKQGLALKARAFTPPIQLTISDGTVDGHPVVVAIVHECDPSAKPCKVIASGAAYLRGYDGDFELSALEEQAFLATRRPPRFDRAPVDEATFADLDEELLSEFLRSVRERDPAAWAASPTTPNCYGAPVSQRPRASQQSQESSLSARIHNNGSHDSSSRSPPTHFPATPPAPVPVTKPRSPARFPACSTKHSPGPVVPSTPPSCPPPTEQCTTASTTHSSRSGN